MDLYLRVCSYGEADDGRRDYMCVCAKVRGGRGKEAESVGEGCGGSGWRGQARHEQTHIVSNLTE